MAQNQGLEITAKGRAKKESCVVDYVRDMLTSVGIKSGQFVLTIVTRVKSGGDHHLGIEIKNVARNAVRLFVQYGDNGTRFDCYLSSSDIKPKQLMSLICAHSTVHGGQYVRAVKAEPPTNPRELTEKFNELRVKVRALTQAKQRIDNIDAELVRLEARRLELEKERPAQLEIVNDPELKQAEADLIEISKILK